MRKRARHGPWDGAVASAVAGAAAADGASCSAPCTAWMAEGRTIRADGGRDIGDSDGCGRISHRQRPQQQRTNPAAGRSGEEPDATAVQRDRRASCSGGAGLFRRQAPRRPTALTPAAAGAGGTARLPRRCMGQLPSPTWRQGERGPRPSHAARRIGRPSLPSLAALGGGGGGNECRAGRPLCRRRGERPPRAPLL